MSSNQLFLVVENIEQCRWNYISIQQEGDIPPGTVVVIRPCHDDTNEFEVHQGSGLLFSPGSMTTLVSREGGLPRHKVVSITDQEFDILLGINLDTNFHIGEARAELYSSNRIKWVCGLKVGDDVLFKPEETSEPVAGVIRRSGTHMLKFTHGLQFIVEITVKS